MSSNGFARRVAASRAREVSSFVRGARADSGSISENVIELGFLLVIGICRNIMS